MIGRTEAEYQENFGPDLANRHFFATVDHFNAIIKFYGPECSEKEGYLWELLDAAEEKIVTGEVDEFCGVMHLPLHWVSVVINFQQLKILYGDSLGGQLPEPELQALE